MGRSAFVTLPAADAPVVPRAWDRDPATGDPLPTGPSLHVPRDGFAAARAAHRHDALLPLLGAGCRDDALALVDGWLRHDLPGQGIGWVHGTDAVARLVHWHAALPQLPAELHPRLAGSALWHVRALESTLPEAGHRRVAHQVGLIVAGFTFPALPDARGSWSAALSGLATSLPELMTTDGADRSGSPGFFAQTLWLVAIARAVARANGSALPGAAEAAWVAGVRHLAQLTGDVGRLPLLGEVPAYTVAALGDYPMAWSLSHLATAWGLDDATGWPDSDADPRCAALGVEAPAEAGAPAKRDLKETEIFRGARAKSMPAPPRGWAMWTWRERGLVAAHMPVKGLPARVLFVADGGEGDFAHVSPLQVTFDVGDAELLADPGSGAFPGWAASRDAHDALRHPGAADRGELRLARVDGKKARIEGAAGAWRRVVLLNQQRLVVTDHVPEGAPLRVSLPWQLGAGWTVTPAGKDWHLTRDGLTVVVQLAPELDWQVVRGHEADAPLGFLLRDGDAIATPAFVGTGEVPGGTELVSSFEVR